MYYFASDVHLGAGDERSSRCVEKRFTRWLDMAAQDADAIFLAGDIFDFWFEYGMVIPKGFARTLGKFAELTDRGVRIVLLTGNHDMWCREYLTSECGVEIWFSPSCVTLAGRKIFVAHGDNMNIGDKPVLRFMNAVFRSRLLRAAFSWLVHPDLAVRFGRWWSGKSRKSHASENLTRDSLGFLIDYAREYKRGNPDIDYIVFGHMHYPCDVREDDLRVLFLGAWDDPRPVYAVLDDDGEMELKRFES